MKTQRSTKLQAQLYKRIKTREILVPQLRMSGRWLEEAGFNIGDQINIEIKKGQLILSPSSKTEEV